MTIHTLEVRGSGPGYHRPTLPRWGTGQQGRAPEGVTGGPSRGEEVAHGSNKLRWVSGKRKANRRCKMLGQNPGPKPEKLPIEPPMASLGGLCYLLHR